MLDKVARSSTMEKCGSKYHITLVVRKPTVGKGIEQKALISSALSYWHKEDAFLIPRVPRSKSVLTYTCSMLILWVQVSGSSCSVRWLEDTKLDHNLICAQIETVAHNILSVSFVAHSSRYQLSNGPDTASLAWTSPLQKKSRFHLHAGHPT